VIERARCLQDVFQLSSMLNGGAVYVAWRACLASMDCNAQANTSWVHAEVLHVLSMSIFALLETMCQGLGNRVPCAHLLQL